MFNDQYSEILMAKFWKLPLKRACAPPPAPIILTIKIILWFFVMTIVSQNPFTLKEENDLWCQETLYTDTALSVWIHFSYVVDA